jgi:radical SAM-linked protein
MRLRLRFTKLGKIRWTSHRDLARMWERALRRAELPVALSEGFSPRPRISFGLALPTGAESVAEYLDIDLEREIALAGVAERLSAGLPNGLDVVVTAAAEGRTSLQQDVALCTWEIDLREPVADLPRRIDSALAASALVVTRERKGQSTEDDIRPGILGLEGDTRRLVCELATQPRGLRPAELLVALGVDPLSGSVRRTHQWIERDGARWEPLPLAAPDAPHARERAS